MSQGPNWKSNFNTIDRYRYNIINTASENFLAKVQYCSLLTTVRDNNFMVNFVQRDRWNVKQPMSN